MCDASFGQADMDLERLLNPRSVAIVGCSANPKRLSSRPMNFLLKKKFSGNIYPVNPKYDEIRGYPAYPSIDAVSEPIDAAVIMVPAAKVEACIRQCADAGAGAAIIISSGFAELGEEGRRIQNRITAISRQANMPVLGPNCLGVINLIDSIPLTFASIMDQDTLYSGGLALVSQSGAIGNFILGVAQQQKIGFSYWVTTGNEAGLEAAAVSRHLLQNDNVSGVLLYMEESRDPQGLIRAGKLARQTGKPLICLKVGRSISGRKAALSHTGSMTGSDQEYEAAFKKAGIIRADNIEELFDLGVVFTTAHKPKGNRVAVMSISGGGGILVADRCEELGLEVPDLDPESQKQLKQVIPAFGSAKNPIDMTAELVASPALLKKSLDIVLDDESTDSILLFFGMNKKNAVGLANDLHEVIDQARKQNKKPILVTWMAAPDTAVDILRRARVPLLFDAIRTTNSLGKLVASGSSDGKAQTASEPSDAAGRFSPENMRSLVKSVLGGPVPPGKFSLTESQCKRIFREIGIAVPRGGVAPDEASALRLAREIGFPLVAKISSPDILHKSDAKAVKVGIENEKQLTTAFHEIVQNSKRYDPKAAVDGVLVEELVPGDPLQVIAGMRWSDKFGPLVLFGMGGVFVEILKDHRLCIAPVDEAEARAMISGLKTAKLFDDFRGLGLRDVNATVDAIVSLSKFGAALGKGLCELDINPLFVLDSGKGVKLGDGLMVLDGSCL